jgi:S1-C subfamily serine protease
MGGCARPPAEFANLPPAVSDLATKAAAGDAVSEAKLGAMYLTGQGGVPRDPSQSMKWLRMAADQGNPGAANDLGVIYANGIGVPQNFAEAKTWYDLAAQRGDRNAIYNIGILYLKGQGIAPDPAQAARYLREAADKGHPGAKFSLGIMYQKGIAVPQDDIEAAILIRASAVAGFGPAQGMLATLYGTGRGVEPDDGLAYVWASLATVHTTGTMSVVSRRLRDEAATRLRPAVLSAAQAAASAWRPGQDLASPIQPGNPELAPMPISVRSTGSGFIVGARGEVVTDDHVVPHCSEVRLHDADGKLEAKVRLVAEDRAADLALLSSVKFGTHLALRTSPAAQGDAIMTYGFPLSPVLGGTGNLTTGTVSASTGLAGDQRTFQITAPVQAGSSGGPVVDGNGAVIGIVESKLNALAVAAAIGDVAQNINFATRANLIRALLDSKEVAYDNERSGRKRSSTELADLLKKATVKVECWR